MRVEIGGRQTGKTTRMIQWLRNNPYAVMYVHSEAEAERLRDLYDEDGIHELANRIVSAMAPRRRSFHSPEVAIDNADLVLQGLFGDVRIVTMTTDKEDVDGDRV